MLVIKIVIVCFPVRSKGLLSTEAHMKIGDIPPNFTLSDQNGNPISLYDYRDKQNVVLFFYPKDDTPG